VKSVVSYPDRGPWGDAHFRGNCSGRLIVDLVEQFHPKFFVDPMVGSGTTREVCEALGVKGWFNDLRYGFNILADEIPVGGDFGFMHPPYFDVIHYSGEVWGDKPDPNDLSRCGSYEEFLAKLNEAQFRLYESLRQGAHMAILVGDVKRKGVLYPIQRDMRWYGEPVNLVIKMQHNCWSDRQDYTGKFIALVHEYLVITRKPNAWIIPIRVTEMRECDLRRTTVSTWRVVVQGALETLGGQAELAALYSVVLDHRKAKEAEQRGQDWRAKVRQTLQRYPDFKPVSRGVWRLVPPGEVATDD